MLGKRQIVILAKSKKGSGHCIAGIDYKTGEWLRPISKSGHEGSIAKNVVENINIFDVVEIDFLDNCENKVQSENYYYNDCFCILNR